MKLLKRFRKNNNEGGTALAKRESGSGGGLARFREEVDHPFDRFWRDFDRNPWSALDHFGNLSTFGGAWANWPAVDMAEDDNAITLRVDVPGLEPGDLDVQVSGRQLTIRGSREEEHHHKRQHRRERLCGSFVRTLSLPDYVDAHGVEARYDKGVLTVTVPKIPGRGPKRVQVKTA